MFVGLCDEVGEGTGGEKKMPKCCEKYCRVAEPDKCASFARCPAWRMWFSEHWQEIQKIFNTPEEVRK